MTAPAAVSWAAYLGWLPLDGQLAWLHRPCSTPWIFTLLAIVELVTDQLPTTPSRKVPHAVRRPPRHRRAVAARPSAPAAGMLIAGLIAGVVGAVDRHARRREVARAAGRRASAATCRPRSSRTPSRSLGALLIVSALSMSRFDAIIIGAGQAGPPLAGRLTAAGMTVAIVERKLFGGTCVNTGCMPTKTLVASAYAAHLARRGADFGVCWTAPVAIDMQAVKARKDEVSRQLARAASKPGCDGMEGCTVFRGHARFEARTTLARRGETLDARRASSSTSAAAPACPTCPASTTVATSPTPRSWSSTPCRGIWSSSAAATSASSSRRCTAASAPR